MCDETNKLLLALMDKVAPQTDDYNYIASPITIGGPTGDYELICPIVSCRWAEYAVVSYANGDGGIASIVFSGDSKPVAMAYDGTKTLNKDTSFNGIAQRMPATTTYFQTASEFFRITNSEKKIYVRIDAANNTSCFVTVRFRVKPIKVVPGPALTVHPDHQHQLNIAREEKTRERLTKMGIPMNVEYHS